MRVLANAALAVPFLWLLFACHESAAVPETSVGGHQWGVISRCRIGDSYESLLKLVDGADSIHRLEDPAHRRRYLTARWNNGRHVLRLEFIDRRLNVAFEQMETLDEHGRVVRRDIQNMNPSRPLPGVAQTMDVEKATP